MGALKYTEGDFAHVQPEYVLLLTVRDGWAGWTSYVTFLRADNNGIYIADSPDGGVLGMGGNAIIAYERIQKVKTFEPSIEILPGWQRPLRLASR